MNILSRSAAVRLKVTGFQVINVGNVPIASLTFAEALELISSPTSYGRSVHFVNAKSVVDANEDPAYANVLQNAWLNLPDGAPVALSMRRGGVSQQQRVSGPDVFDSLRTTKSDENRHFLIGATDAVLETLARTSPATIVGTLSPPIMSHTEFDIPHFVELIRSTSATHVWVGLGSPKQDFVCSYIAQNCNVTVLGVGAAFDFAAGTQRRAPHLLRVSGLEWLYRLCTEPRRLASRYLIGNLKFLNIELGARAREHRRQP